MRSWSSDSLVGSVVKAQVLGFELPADEGVEPVEIENLGS